MGHLNREQVGGENERGRLHEGTAVPGAIERAGGGDRGHAGSGGDGLGTGTAQLWLIRGSGVRDVPEELTLSRGEALDQEVIESVEPLSVDRDRGGAGQEEPVNCCDGLEQGERGDGTVRGNKGRVIPRAVIDPEEEGGPGHIGTRITQTCFGPVHHGDLPGIIQEVSRVEVAVHGADLGWRETGLEIGEKDGEIGVVFDASQPRAGGGRKDGLERGLVNSPQESCGLKNGAAEGAARVARDQKGPLALVRPRSRLGNG